VRYGARFRFRVDAVVGGSNPPAPTIYRAKNRSTRRGGPVIGNALALA
jgi:hypothetical protein